MPEALAALDGLLPETVLSIEGTVVAEPQAPGGWSALADHRSAPPVREAAPIGLNKPVLNTSLPVFLDHAVIGLRHPQKRAVPPVGGHHGRLSGDAEQSGVHRDSDAEAGRLGDRRRRGVFAVKYFERTAYLSQSPESNKQIMVGVSSGSTRSARFSVPSHTAPSATSTNTSASIWRWASSATIWTSWRC